MRKKDTLYRANKFNKALFMPNGNIFDIGGVKTTGLGSVYNTNPFDVGQGLSGKALQGLQDANRNMAINNAFNLGAQKGATSATASGVNSMVGMAAGGLGATVGNMAGNAIAGDHELGGVDEVVTALQSANTGNPLIDGAKNLALGVVGGTVKRAFGMATDEEKLAAVNSGINQNNNFVSNAGNFDAIQGPVATATDTNVYKGGWFAGGSKARRKNEELRNRMIDARQFAQRSVDNNISNLQEDQLNNALANYAAFGGPISTDDMGAVNYGFMSDYLTQKKRESDMKNKIAGISSMPAFMPNSFAIGGDLQTNGADFSSGLTHINAGLSHEENPNDGVQLGTDENGTPNLVEENETVWNDYVFSNRILADEATKSLFKLPRKKDITFADISKKLEKEIAERPADPISQAGFNAQMQQLEEQQERQKQEMEAERAKAAFEALSPEEQTAVMQRAAQEEQAAQQMAQQQAIAEQQAAMQQPSQEEIPMVQQQQMMQADGSEAALGQEPENLMLLQQNVNALGGELVKASDVEPNRFDYGGKKGSKKAKRIARKYDEQWFKNMAKSLGISDKEMEGFIYSADDPEANLVAFNNIYRNNQYDKARDIYRKGQRQSKRNELFGDRGLYSYSDDKSKIYKARTNDVDRNGWINKDYTGAVDSEGKMLGFLSQEEYDKLKPEEKEAYKRINERAGDRMYDYNGRIIKDLYNGTEDELLNSFDTDYDKGFKWDDKDAQTVQYPVGIEHSATSAMRYIPTIGGAIGLANDIFSSPDYSRPQAIIAASRGLATPSQVQPHYIGNYLTYRPLDVLYQQNALNAQSRATDRQLMNTSGGNRGTAMAGLLANGYNSQLASGNLFRQAQEYNDALKRKVEDFNRGTNIFNANADMYSQKTNAMLRQQAGRLGLQGLMTGYGMMDDIDARRQASMNANLTNVLQSLGNIGEEAYDEDRLRWLERTGTLKSSTLSANGGKLKKKKRGLTF